jgi:ubiquinone/menaquinone biosynthesis C-methylase UbiE
MPFDNAMFDLVWTQHASMNIANETGLYCEMHRVLKCISDNAKDVKRQGTLAVYDIYKGNNYDDSSFHLPVPWPSHTSSSFLVYPEDALGALHDAGFKKIIWDDKTGDALKWFREMMTERFQEVRNASWQLGLQIIVGPRWQTMVQNLLKNYEEGQIVLVQGIFK